MIALAIACFATVLILDLRSDYLLWKRNKPVNHIRGAVIRTLGLIPSILILSLPMTAMSFGQVFLKLLLVSGVIFGAWWILFDGIYNRLRGYGWWFNGSIDLDDAWLDKFLRNMPDWQEASIKLGIFLLFLTFLLILY